MAVSDADTVAFLAWAAGRLGLRPAGFRNVRGTVRKRLARRVTELGLGGLDAYRAYLAGAPEEWEALASMCRIPLSRLYRDRAAWDRLTTDILPAAAARAKEVVRVWSAGSASGEEPWTIAIVWHLVVAPAHRGKRLELLATDVEPGMIARGERGAYEEGSLRELPEELRARALDREGELFVVRPELREGVTFLRQDLRREMPDGPFDLILCRNVAFTYFDEASQRAVAAGLRARLAPGGVIVVGEGEALPPA